MIIYTDGASSPDRAGGWAWAVSDAQYDSGATGDTTNQRMEIYAAIEALNAFSPGDMTIVSDSRYVVDCMTRKWYAKWRRNGWKTKEGNPVISQDLWEGLLEAVKRHSSVRFTWVKGHSGDPLNDLADRLAVRAKEEGREERQEAEKWNTQQS